MLRNQKGFTLIEIIAVLVILGILAAVAIPKYMDIQQEARNKAAVGQIAEVKGRLSVALAGYMLSNSGTKPAAADLLLFANARTTNSCPAAATVEGDFKFLCAAANVSTITVTVQAVQATTLTTPKIGTYSLGS